MTKRRTKNRTKRSTKNGKRRNTKQIKRKTYRKIYNKTKKGGMFRALGKLVPQCLMPRSLIHLVVARWRLIDPDNNINWNDDETSNDNEHFTCSLRTTNKFNLDEKILHKFRDQQYYTEFKNRKRREETAEDILQLESKYDSIARIFKPVHREKIINLIKDSYSINFEYRGLLKDFYFKWYNVINEDNPITKEDLSPDNPAEHGSTIDSTHYGFRTTTQNDEN